MTQDSQFPPTWPGCRGQEQQPGMTIKGKVIMARKFKNQNGEDRVAIDIQGPNGGVMSVAGWHLALHQILDELGREGALKRGSEVEIAYHGEKQLDGGRRLKLYTVNGREASAGGATPDWFDAAPQIQPAATQAQRQAGGIPVASGAPGDDVPF